MGYNVSHFPVEELNVITYSGLKLCGRLQFFRRKIITLF